MTMIVVNYEKQLREAFAAGQSSMLPKLYRGKIDAGTAAWLAKIPATYEEWMKSREGRPQIARG